MVRPMNWKSIYSCIFCSYHIVKLALKSILYQKDFMELVENELNNVNEESTTTKIVTEESPPSQTSSKKTSSNNGKTKKKSSKKEKSNQ